MAIIGICTVPDCGNPRRLKLYCEKHYQRWRKYGDVGFTKVAGAGEPQRFLREIVLPYRGDECLTWPFATNGNGYGRVVVDGKLEYPHRLACEEINGPPPTLKHEAAHSCGNGNRGCVTPKHTRWATHTENMTDKEKHGTKQWGERASGAKLTADDVRLIRSLRGVRTTIEIAEQFGIVRHTVRMIQRRKTWPHVV